jgi:hypothetical protein
MQLFSNFFNQESIKIDPRISRALSTSVESVIHGSSLSLTSIGRNNGSRQNSSEKHSIKRVDRLLGNSSLHDSRLQFYQLIANQFITTKHPLIIVDWSSVYNYNFVMLRASIPIDGRAITLYEEIYPDTRHGNHKAHVSFLAKLATLLPRGCKPIICTDAGFKVPWFKAINKHDWYWLGRVRGVIYCKLKGETSWECVSLHHHKAKTKASELPPCSLSKAHEFPCRAILYRNKPKGRKNLNRKGVVTECFNNKKHAKSAKEPWFLVSNLPKETYLPHQLVALYKRRMTIEETFRDNKNEYYGLGLSRSRSLSIPRLENILLIAMMAQISLYIIGKAAELNGYHRNFQANTEKRRVLSYGYLALRILKHSNKKYPITQRMIRIALIEIIKESYG